MNTIKLTGVHSGEPIFVNLDNVSFYHYDSSPSGVTKYTQIYFGSDSHWIRVKETPEEILNIINGPVIQDYIQKEDSESIAERKADYWVDHIIENPID